ncbi:MAG: hypothetical protein GX963_10010 [Bacteroidales bacterium]|nr:hypothetical protein [Bacteroidales bacterium]
MKNLRLLFLTIPFILFACSSDDDDNNKLKLISKSEVTLNSLDKHQIEVESEDNVAYSVENENHAKVDEKGLVTALLIGETDINITDGSKNAKVKIKVEPKENLYTEPILDFTLSKSDVIKKLGKPAVDNDDGIAYESANKAVDLVMYLFDENGKMTGTSVSIRSSYGERLVNFLAERYMIVSSKERLFSNTVDIKKTTMVVHISIGDYENLLVHYMPYSPTTRSLQGGMFEELKDSALQIIDSNK